MNAPLGLATLEALAAPTDRDAWLEERKRGLGGTDMAAILGQVPKRSAIDVWLDKTGRTPLESFDGNERTEVGTMLEGVVADWFAEGAPKWPRKGHPLLLVQPPMLRRRDRPWQLCNPDRVAYEPERLVQWRASLPGQGMLEYRPEAGLEIKTHGFMAGRSYGADDDDLEQVPDDKRIQALWYQSAIEVPTYYLAALIDTHRRRTWVIHRDLRAEGALLEIAEDFWRRYVLADVAPPADGSLSYATFLRREHALHSAEVRAQTPEVDAVAQEYRRAHVAEKAAKKDKEKLAQQLQTVIGDALGVETSEGRITWGVRASGRLRDAQLRAHLYSRLGLTDDEIEQLEIDFEMPGFRAMNHGRW